MGSKSREGIIENLCTLVAEHFESLAIFEPTLVPAQNYFVENTSSSSPVAFLASIQYGELGPVFLIPEGRSLIGRHKASREHYPILCGLVEASQWLFKCSGAVAQVIDPDSEYRSILIKSIEFKLGESTPQERMDSGEGEKLSTENWLTLQSGDILVNHYSAFLFGKFD